MSSSTENVWWLSGNNLGVGSWDLSLETVSAILTTGSVLSIHYNGIPTFSNLDTALEIPEDALLGVVYGVLADLGDEPELNEQKFNRAVMNMKRRGNVTSNSSAGPVPLRFIQ